MNDITITVPIPIHFDIYAMADVTMDYIEDLIYENLPDETEMSDETADKILVAVAKNIIERLG